MSDYFGRLAARTLDPSSLLKPRIDARFAARDEIEEPVAAESLALPCSVWTAPEKERAVERVALATPSAAATEGPVTVSTTRDAPRPVTATPREVHERSETKHTEASRQVIVEKHERRDSTQSPKAGRPREEGAARVAEARAGATSRTKSDVAGAAPERHETTPHSMEVTSHSMEALSMPASPAPPGLQSPALPGRSTTATTQAAAAPRAEAIRLSADAQVAVSPRIEARMVERVIDRAPAAPQEPDIHITIGRIDVRAVTPASATAPPPARRDPRPKTLSLEEYLAQRNEARR